MADYKTLVDERKVKREPCAEGTRRYSGRHDQMGRQPK